VRRRQDDEETPVGVGGTANEKTKMEVQLSWNASLIRGGERERKKGKAEREENSRTTSW